VGLVAARGSARTTIPIPSALILSAGMRAAARCRKRRLTRLRVTAFPTAPLTTKPTRGPSPRCPSSRRPSSRRTAWTTSVGRLTRSPRLVVRRKSFERRILNDRGNIRSIDHTQADRRARPLRRRAEIIARPARVRIRKRKPWVRLRRRLLGWNVRLLTEELPYLRSARQIGYGADTARIAGGAGRWQRPLGKRPSNGTGRRQTGQTGVIVLTRDLGGSMFLAPSVGNCAPADSSDAQAANKKSVQGTRRTVWRISQTRLRTESSVASVAVRLTVSRQLHKAATSCTHICAHSVDICVEARAVTIPRVPTRQREGADNSRSLLRVSGSTSDARRLRSHQ
jgi:hypothetical protein